MQLKVLHLEGKQVGTLPGELGAASRRIIAGGELTHVDTLDAAIAFAKQATAGPAKQGVYVMGGKRGYEVYLANLEPVGGGTPAAFHFEGWHQKFAWQRPQHTLDVGQAFVDGDTVLVR